MNCAKRTAGFFYFIFPLTEQHLGAISFGFYVGADEPVAQARELVTQIINIVQLDLSPESQAQLDQVKQEMGELKLSREFARLKWPINAEEIERPLASGALLSQD